ncbi:MAG: type I pullulanase [Oscillospiraceae bacterium]|nr:type I pullulanase [Oscillospiraceae bacterium]
MNCFDFKAADRQYYRGRLGAVYSRARTVFRVWQPFAESAVLRLYNADGEVTFSAPMKRNGGVFEYEKRGDLDGVWYTYLITRNGETVETADPYAALVTADGERGQVVDMRRHAPDGWENERNISAENPIIYELSVRDFSMDKGADFVNRGKFSAFCEEGVRNSRGDTVGLDYIKDLGVTHIQLMPIFDFDLDGGEYNWGYNPRFYNAPSAYYSQSDGVLELRRLVAAAHKRGLGVIADVVYNHVFSAEDSAFGRIFPRYYFRGRDGYSNGSGCGNEFASERKMARKFILDSLEFLAREYKLDGFRFDLMGLLDLRTLREAERRLRRINPDILLYGEGWTGGASAYPERYRAVLRNAGQLPGYAFFNDSFRDGVKGSVFCAEDRGYVNGAPDKGHLDPIKWALTGQFPESFWTGDAAQTINYAECHDNLTLFDKLTISLDGADGERVVKADKMAAALIMLSRGIAFIQAGQELLRTKNGDGNSYCAPDSVNSLKWNSRSENREIVEYYRGLIAFRRRFGGISERKLQTLGGGFFLTFGDFLLIVNPTDKKLTAKLSGTFEVYADGNRASDAPLYTRKRLSCAEYSILLARRTDNETDR